MEHLKSSEYPPPITILIFLPWWKRKAAVRLEGSFFIGTSLLPFLVEGSSRMSFFRPSSQCSSRPWRSFRSLCWCSSSQCMYGCQACTLSHAAWAYSLETAHHWLPRLTWSSLFPCLILLNVMSFPSAMANLWTASKVHIFLPLSVAHLLLNLQYCVSTSLTIPFPLYRLFFSSGGDSQFLFSPFL